MRVSPLQAPLVFSIYNVSKLICIIYHDFVSVPEYLRLIHVERVLGGFEITRVHFGGRGDSKLCNKTGVDALPEGCSVVGFVYLAKEVFRGN